MELQCRHNANKICQYCHEVTAQDGWSFAGCDYPPYQGKWVAEIKKCPKTINEKLNEKLQRKIRTSS